MQEVTACPSGCGDPQQVQLLGQPLTPQSVRVVGPSPTTHPSLFSSSRPTVSRLRVSFLGAFSFFIRPPLGSVDTMDWLAEQVPPSSSFRRSRASPKCHPIRECALLERTRRLARCVSRLVRRTEPDLRPRPRLVRRMRASVRRDVRLARRTDRETRRFVRPARRTLERFGGSVRLSRRTRDPARRSTRLPRPRVRFLRRGDRFSRRLVGWLRPRQPGQISRTGFAVLGVDGDAGLSGLSQKQVPPSSSTSRRRAATPGFRRARGLPALRPRSGFGRLLTLGRSREDTTCSMA
jgi:hypothetical protein